MLPAGRTLRARRFAPVHLAPLGSTVALADQISREFNVSDQAGRAVSLSCNQRTVRENVVRAFQPVPNEDAG